MLKPDGPRMIPPMIYPNMDGRPIKVHTKPHRNDNSTRYTTSCKQYIYIVGIIADNFRKFCDTFCIVFSNMTLMSDFSRCGINLFVLMPSIFSSHLLPPTCLDGFSGCPERQDISIQGKSGQRAAPFDSAEP